MPAYKYTLKNGKSLWYAAFNYTDWTGKYRHTCKRGFKTQREAKEYERNFLDQQSVTPDILFSSLVENYLEDMEHRLKPTTMENKRNIIISKLLPYFANLKVCDIDTIKIRKWQNEIPGRGGKTLLSDIFKNPQQSAVRYFELCSETLPSFLKPLSCCREHRKKQCGRNADLDQGRV